MPTFLVTPRMPPALRRRIHESVRLDLRQRTLFPNRGRGRMVLRIALAGAALGLAVFLVLTYRQSRREVEDKRQAILAEYRRLEASVPEDTRTRAWRKLPGLLSTQRRSVRSDYEYNHGLEGHLNDLLQRTFVYIRADAQELDSPASALDAARESSVDALASCLVTPPTNLKESTLLRAIGQAPPADRVLSFADLLHALEFFETTFEKEVRTATQMQELERLARRLEREELQRGLIALRAPLLVVAIDQPKQSGIVSDFDGEAPHDIVLRVFDLWEGAALVWHEQRSVDPAWISAKSRLAYSRPLDSCKLAYELRQPPGP
jgi:hypothetical protein